MQNQKLASLLKRHRNIHVKKSKKGRICKKKLSIYRTPLSSSPWIPRPPRQKIWIVDEFKQCPNRRFWGYCSHLARWCKLWSNLYKMLCSSLWCHVLVWDITVKKLWGFAHEVGSQIFFLTSFSDANFYIYQLPEKWQWEKSWY